MSSKSTEKNGGTSGGGEGSKRKNGDEGAFAEPLLAKQEDTSDTECSTKNDSGMALQIIKSKPKWITDLANSDDLVCFNIGGRKYFVMARNFVNMPNSRLSSMIRCTEKSEIEKYCDLYKEGEIPEYFFDRSGKGFNDILDVYRTGALHLTSTGVCSMKMRFEMEYWGIDELLLDPCCALKYYPEIELCEKEIERQNDSQQKYLQTLEEEDFGDDKIGKIRKFLWNMTEYPETSVAARVCAFTSIAVVLISTITFVLSTLPELTDNIDIILFDNSTEDGEIEEQAIQQPHPERWDEGILALKIVDEMTMWFFTIEYLVRFICAPKKWKFFKGPLNIIDLLAILPYFVGFIVEEIKDTVVVGRAGKVLRLIRVMRILRVFKLVRHFAGLQSLLSTLKQAYKELGLLMILVGVSVLTVSSLVYFAEKDSKAKWSFMDSFWWGLMVLTTVGYGSTAPSTPMGKGIGAFCALLGVFILALPVPIVVNRFADFSNNYKNRLWRNEVMMKKQQDAAELKGFKVKGDEKCNGSIVAAKA